MLLKKVMAEESGSEDDERNRDVANIARCEEFIKNKLAEIEERNYSITESDNMSDLDYVEEEQVYYTRKGKRVIIDSDEDYDKRKPDDFSKKMKAKKKEA